MLRWIIIFLVLILATALVAGGGISGDGADVANVIFFIFTILLVLGFVMNTARH